MKGAAFKNYDLPNPDVAYLRFLFRSPRSQLVESQLLLYRIKLRFTLLQKSQNVINLTVFCNLHLWSVHQQQTWTHSAIPKSVLQYSVATASCAIHRYRTKLCSFISVRTEISCSLLSSLIYTCLRRHAAQLFTQNYIKQDLKFEFLSYKIKKDISLRR